MEWRTASTVMKLLNSGKRAVSGGPEQAPKPISPARKTRLSHCIPISFQKSRGAYRNGILARHGGRLVRRYRIWCQKAPCVQQAAAIHRPIAAFHVDLEKRARPDLPLQVIRGPANGALTDLSWAFDAPYSFLGGHSLPPERLIRA
jgi:hypothetical protein